MNVGIIPYCEIIPDSRGRRALVSPKIYTCRSTGRHDWEGFRVIPCELSQKKAMFDGTISEFDVIWYIN